jgi:hypothetical protein
MRQMVDERIVKAMIHHEIFEGAIQTYAVQRQLLLCTDDN